MTKPETTQMSGVERLRKRRNAFLRYCALGTLAGLILGLVSGASTEFYKNGDIPLALLIAMMVITAAGFVWFSVDYYRRVDEIDLLDNLWANTAGLYGGLIVFGSWTLLADTQVVGSPNAGVIVAASLAIALIAYVARKLGWR